MARSGNQTALSWLSKLRFGFIQIWSTLIVISPPCTATTEGNSSEKAAFYQQEAAKIIRSRPRARTAKADRTEKLFDLPKIPNREERLKILLRERPDPKPDAKR